MGTTFAQGQLAQLGSIVNIGTATALPKVAAKYDPKRLLKALDGKGEIFASRLEAALEQAFNAGLIAKQPNGEEGALVNNGFANLFYTDSCVVGVFWDAVYRKWSVDAWQRDDNRWNARNQVVSRNSFIFSRFYGREFLFNPFFQPPSARPISSS